MKHLVKHFMTRNRIAKQLHLCTGCAQSIVQNLKAEQP